MEMETSISNESSVSSRYDVPFLLERYSALQEHLARTGELATDSDVSKNRRHDFYLRDLVEKRDYGDAMLYVNSVIDFLDIVDDSASSRYRRYRDRVIELFMEEY